MAQLEERRHEKRAELLMSIHESAEDSLKVAKS
jgi:hypothetical protein